MNESTPPTALVAQKTYPSLVSLISIIVIIVLVFAFISGWTIKFYASFLFFFYSFIGSMWISVIGLGIFQTLLMMPIRIVNLTKGANTDDFIKTIVEQNKDQEQQILIKKHAHKGTPALMWYTVSFSIQLVAYISMGRLFLTDFYSIPLNPKLLFDWVTYPSYPIQGTIFKIPYIGVTDTINLGFKGVFAAWGILILVRTLISFFKYLQLKLAKNSIKTDPILSTNQLFSELVNFWNGSFFLLMIGAFFLMRNFPIGIELRIFSGSITIPNITLNTITALATFFTIFWLDLSKNRKRATLAKKQGIDQKIIDQTQQELFKNSLRNASLLGLGAFFITNQIPSAFELSIFTLEIISWFAPFTIDKIILKANPSKSPVETTGMTPPPEEKPQENLPHNPQKVLQQ
jgi:hypothetical protein